MIIIFGLNDVLIIVHILNFFIINFNNYLSKEGFRLGITRSTQLD